MWCNDGFYVITGVIFFSFFFSLIERETDRSYTFSDFVKDEGGWGDQQAKHSFAERYFKPLFLFTQKSLNLSEDKRENLQMKLKQAGMKQTPETFVATKIIYAMFVLIFFLIAFVLNHNMILLALGIAGTIIMYIYPNQQLEKNIKYATAMRRLELPDFLTPLGLMMYSYTPYQSVKECEKFAGPFLKPYVEQLTLEMDLEPGSVRPFQNFAKQIGVAQAQTFVVAIQQALTTDRNRSRGILQKQVDVMRKLREESYNELIYKKPLAVNKYNAFMLLNMALIPLSMLFFVFNDVFGNLTK